MAWAKVINKSNGEFHYDMTPSEWNPDDYDIIYITDDRPPEGLEQVDEEGNIFVPLETMKQVLWSQVKAIRNNLENDIAPTTFGNVQCDDRSKIKINGLVSMASIALNLSLPFEEHFTLADNSVVTLNANEVIQLGTAVGIFISDIYTNARNLRTSINDAVSIAELEAIDIDSGWPETT